MLSIILDYPNYAKHVCQILKESDDKLIFLRKKKQLATNLYLGNDFSDFLQI